MKVNCMFSKLRPALQTFFGSSRDIMVNELSVLHEHESVPAVQVGHVRVDDDGN